MQGDKAGDETEGLQSPSCETPSLRKFSETSLLKNAAPAAEFVRVFPCTAAPGENICTCFVGKPRPGGGVQGDRAEDDAVGLQPPSGKMPLLR